MTDRPGERVARWWLRGSSKRWPELFFALNGLFLVGLGFWNGFRPLVLVQGALVLMAAVVAFERRQYGLIIHRLEEENASLRSAREPH